VQEEVEGRLVIRLTDLRGALSAYADLLEARNG
jgi:hypothetical protein